MLFEKYWFYSSNLENNFVYSALYWMPFQQSGTIWDKYSSYQQLILLTTMHSKLHV